ncbi:hypothetical protein L596_030668 [Steinernema carpocapsae]|uniref:Chromatin modification-related protein MEAF6 n=1 Tax=Steinernema carpocapsae TaxID=34508 RepID=A0A4U5LQ32_STECR|nr:hypothetical protein L596_030668 [Steinernema carpocapsae]
MARKMTEELDTLIKQREQLKKDLIRIEQDIYHSETMFFTGTPASGGNLIQGFLHDASQTTYINLEHRKSTYMVPGDPVEQSLRIFSGSSVTSAGAIWERVVTKITKTAKKKTGGVVGDTDENGSSLKHDEDGV